MNDCGVTTRRLLLLLLLFGGPFADARTSCMHLHFFLLTSCMHLHFCVCIFCYIARFRSCGNNAMPTTTHVDRKGEAGSGVVTHGFASLSKQC